MTTPRRPGRPSADEITLSTEELLDAALDAFAERGYDGTSVRELARKLGVSHNLIPQRIGSKEKLWFAAVDHGFGTLEAELEAVAAASIGLDDVEMLRTIVRAFITVNVRRPALLRIINKEAVADGPRLDHLFVHYVEPVRLYGAEALARLEAAGRVRTGSVGLVYFLMTHGAAGPAALPGLAARFGEAVDPNDEEAVRRHAEETTALIFDGLILPEPVA
ncbi:MAG TPA: helix-turn-helix domain-containing protein [Iamia sp.]|nr:helix-turn-helix domain-containing protein [Iamia sp.]